MEALVFSGDQMGADAAAWAQAYLSAAAIVFSTAIAVFVPWNERRLNRRREEAARLGIECRRSDTGGLEVVIAYTPEFQNYAVGVSMWLKSPTDARVYKGLFAGGENGANECRPDGLGESVRYNAVSLREYDNSGIYRGCMFIEYPDERKGPLRADVELSVLIHGNYLIHKRTLHLTAIDDQHYGRGGPVAVIKSSRPFG